MNIGELISIKTLEKSKDSLSEEKHTPYRDEIRLFSCVQQGDLNSLLTQIKNIDASITMGKMSNDDVVQYKYMAVSTITLATRYAIQGGLNEKDAYAFSDRVIMLVDSLTTREEILLCIASEIVKLTKAVKKSKKQPSQSPHIKKCICYINENMHKKITVSELSEHCGISADYLSQIFKREIGENLSTYITKKKIDASKQMLSKNASYSTICNELGFSSQSHFITLFKKHCKMTPSEYIKLLK